MKSLVRLLQIASPALPIGGYSYSSGLESAIECGEVGDPDSACAWIDDALSLVVGRFDAPLVAAAMQACSDGDQSRIDELNRMALAARETAELRLECEQMGYSLTQWIDQVPGRIDQQALAAQADGELEKARGAEATLPSPAPPVAFAVAWAVAAWRLRLSAGDAVTAFLWSFVENQVMVLIKTIPLGQIQAQRLLHRLGPRIEAVAQAALQLAPSQWSNSAPGLAIASMAHENQYSRLFRS
jgi:urease accessory protein